MTGRIGSKSKSPADGAAAAAGRRSPAVFVLLFLLVSGCAYVPLEPFGSERTARTLDPDERHLWKESRRLQHEIEISGLLFEDEALDRYLARVLERVSPPELSTALVEPRVRVISDVNIHGYSFANGMIYIHTALLSRMANESQLATLLSRELAHVIDRHALRASRDKKAQADTLAWIGVGASVVQGGGNYKLLAQAASISSLAGFHYLLETAADEKGLAILAAAGYDVREAPKFFRMTIDHLAEVHSQGVWGWAPFSPPVQMTARIAGYEKLIASQYGDSRATRRRPIADPPAFQRKVHRATLRQTELELAAGLFVSAESSARRATESDPRDPEALVLFGRALVGQRSKPLPGRDLPSIRKVRAAFESALRLDPRHAVATRELGMSFYRKTGSTRGRKATVEALRRFRRYLRIAPAAEDADYVRGYIAELEAESR